MGILRLLLALSVIADHAAGIFGNRLVGGPTAVQSFYLISGFYMALVLNGKYNFPGSYKLFITQRALRLYPLYFLILVLTVFWAWAGWHWTGVAYANGATWQSAPVSSGSQFWLILSQFTIIGQDAISFLGLTGSTLSLHFVPHSLTTEHPAWTYLLVPQAWSVSVELLFYCLAPFLVRLTVKRQLLFVAATMAARATIYWGLGLDYDPWTHRLLPLELGVFVLGSLAYQFYCRYEGWFQSRTDLAVFALAAIGAFSLFYYNLQVPFKRPAFYALVLVSLPSLFGAFNKNRIDAWIAELSYPVYMVHMLVIYVSHGLFEQNPRYAGLAYAAISVLAAAILYHVFMKPFETFRKRVFRRSTTEKHAAVEQSDERVLTPEPLAD